MSTNPGNTDPIDATASDNLTPEERAKMAKFWEQREGKSANGNTTAHGSSDDQNGSEAHDPVAVGDAESEPEQIEMTDKPRSLREAAGGGWVIVPNNLPVDAKIQPAEIVQIVYPLNPNDHDHDAIIGFFVHESIVKNEAWYKAFEDKLFDTFPELEEAANAVEEGEPNEEPTEPATPPSFPGFTLKEIADFDLNFREDCGVEYRQSEDGKQFWLVLTKPGIKEFRKFEFWREKRLPPHELDGRKFAAQMSSFIASQHGKFLQDDVGRYHVLIHGRRIPIDATSDAMKAFLGTVCGITSLSVASAMAVERLRIESYRAASQMTFRQLSAMYDDRVYLPITDARKLLLVTPADISLVPNGDNHDAVWLEHPEHAPFVYRADREDVLPALQTFEEFFVNSQACEVPAMRWFVAMAEGLFPIVRDACSSNRFIVLHIGEKGHGKTTGAKSFVLLHGFEDVMGDASVASLSSIPEQGLVVCDNKESRNFTQPLIDYFIRLATGGQFLRCMDGGKTVRRGAPRPVGVITSIEGVHKAELHDRIVKVKYFLKGGQERLDRDALEDTQRAARNRIMSAMPVVLREYLRVRIDPKVSIEARPIDRFNRHFRELCYLLIAYGRVTRGADAGDTWAKDIIQAWDHEIRDTRDDGADDAPVSALEAPVLEIVTNNGTGHLPIPFTWEGRRGKMYIVHPGDLLLALKRNLAIQRNLPEEPAQFSQRLGSERFERFVVIRNTKERPVEELKRNSQGARIGIFVPDAV
jgi:hypothetical protein